MKQAGADAKTPVPVVRARRSLRWLDSLTWLAIAGALTAMLVPAKSEQSASKRAGGENGSMAATASEKNAPSPFGPHDDVTYMPSHEFILQNEADFISAQNAPPAPGAEVRQQPGENTQDNSPRVTSGPTLDGPELGNPIPR